MPSGNVGLLSEMESDGYFAHIYRVAVEYRFHHCCILHGFTPVSYIAKLHLLDIIQAQTLAREAVLTVGIV